MRIYDYFKTIIYGVITPCIAIYGIHFIIKNTIKDILVEFIKYKFKETMKEAIKDAIAKYLEETRTKLIS